MVSKIEKKKIGSRIEKTGAPFALRERFFAFVLLSESRSAYIGRVRTRPDYGDKRARNKRTGPGCDSRRLHQPYPPRVIGGAFMGPISIDRRLKALLSPGVAHRFGPFSKCER